MLLFAPNPIYDGQMDKWTVGFFIVFTGEKNNTKNEVKRREKKNGAAAATLTLKEHAFE